MKKLAKYLKPYIIPLIMCLILLFGQALCDLNLPNYMSDIVNVGLQRGGIESSVPDAVSEKGMQLMRIFMNAEEQKLLDESYSLKQKGDATYKNQYPLIKDENIYVLNYDKNTYEELNRAFGTAGWTFINTMKEIMPESSTTEESEGTTPTIDITQMYEMLPMLQALPQEMIATARDNAEKVAESTQLQTGATFVKSFYQELGVDTDSIQSRYIIKAGLLMLLIALLGGVATVVVGFLAARIAAGVARSLRHDVFARVESFSNSEFDQYSTASLITRTTNDITQVQMLLVMGIRMICYAPIMGIGGTVMALNKSVSMSWTIALAVVILIGVVMVVFSIAMPKFKLVQKMIDKINLVSRENLSGIMVIRAFGTQKFEEKRFDDANRDLTKTHLFVNRVMAAMMPIMMLVMNCITLLIVWVGAHQISNSAMQVGDMMAFMQYAMQIIMAFLMISMMFIMVPRASVSGDRVAEVLATESSVKDAANTVDFSSKKSRGLLEFKDVCFRYQGADEDVLEHITFTAKPGETTAFIGSTGSGKSTLVNLIPRFYDVTQGQILVDGIDIRQVPQKELRDQIGYVPQKGVLLSGTIASNLRYGDKDATDEELMVAAEVAQASEFISEKEDGINSEITEGGTNVSGGQKQRLSIARALVKKPSIFIFDDSFSALDFKTDAKLRSALKKHTGDSTVLIVAQRVSTIMHAEQIIVLEDGKVVGKGTHKELLMNCPTYQEIATSQLSKEELE